MEGSLERRLGVREGGRKEGKKERKNGWTKRKGSKGKIRKETKGRNGREEGIRDDS